MALSNISVPLTSETAPGLIGFSLENVLISGFGLRVINTFARTGARVHGPGQAHRG